MRLGIIGDNIFEKILLWLGLVPEPLMDAMWGMGKTRIFLTGLKLGFFEALGNEWKSAAEVSKLTACTPQASEKLLNALNGFGYLKRKNGLYANTRQIKRWVNKGSRFSIAGSFPFADDIWYMLEDLEAGIKEGKNYNFHHLHKSPQFWENYMRSLATFSKIVAGEIVKRVKLTKKPERLLDIGGGHGSYSIAFCAQYPGMSADILDLPPAVKVGKEIVSEQKMTKFVNYREGDLRNSEWGQSYDLVLLFNIIHTLHDDEAERSINKAYQALNKGGTVIILDSEYSNNQKNLTTTEGFNQLLFYLISDARIYQEREMTDWLIKAGFTKIKNRHLLSMPMSVMITAQK